MHVASASKPHMWYNLKGADEDVEFTTALVCNALAPKPHMWNNLMEADKHWILPQPWIRNRQLGQRGCKASMASV